MVVVSGQAEKIQRSLKLIRYSDRLCPQKWITIFGKRWLQQFPFRLALLPPLSLPDCNLIAMSPPRSLRYT